MAFAVLSDGREESLENVEVSPWRRRGQDSDGFER
jgi:hypothetical protein